MRWLWTAWNIDSEKEVSFYLLFSVVRNLLYSTSECRGFRSIFGDVYASNVLWSAVIQTDSRVCTIRIGTGGARVMESSAARRTSSHYYDGMKSRKNSPNLSPYLSVDLLLGCIFYHLRPNLHQGSLYRSFQTSFKVSSFLHSRDSVDLECLLAQGVLPSYALGGQPWTKPGL